MMCVVMRDARHVHVHVPLCVQRDVINRDGCVREGAAIRLDHSGQGTDWQLGE